MVVSRGGCLMKTQTTYVNMKYVSCIIVSTLNSEGPWNKRFMLALQIINQAKSVCIIILLLRARCSYETKQTNGPQPFYSRVQTQIYAFNSCFIMLRAQVWVRSCFDFVTKVPTFWHLTSWPVTNDQWPPCLLTSHLGGLEHAAPLASTLLARR